MISTNREHLKIAATMLGDMCNDVVFVGGAVVDLYATNPAAPAPRPTLDVDCIIEIPTRVAYSQLEDALRRKGFVHDQSEGVPLCRWVVRGITIDLMPVDSDILGFTNEWYREGFHHTFTVSLGDGITIRLLESPYFLATKLVAMNSRGIADLRTSLDFEDIVYLLRNRESLPSEISHAEAGVKSYLSKTFGDLRKLSEISEAVAAALEFRVPAGTHAKILSTMELIGAMHSS
jgi:hypothetical protein